MNNVSKKVSYFIVTKNFLERLLYCHLVTFQSYSMSLVILRYEYEVLD